MALLQQVPADIPQLLNGAVLIISKRRTHTLLQYAIRTEPTNSDRRHNII